MREAKKIIKLLLVTMIMTIAMVTSIFADEVNEDVKNARKGVLQIRISYESKDGTEYFLGGGSAFLVNETTIVTCYHVTHADGYLEWATQNIEGFDNNKIKYKVVVRNDITLEAKLKKESAQSDFAILELEQPIGNREVLRLNTNNVSATQQIFALGFPDSVTEVQNNNTYTYDDVTIKDGRVTKITSIDGVDVVQHSAQLSNGYSGGPLVDYEGYVIGFNDASHQDNYYSVAITELTNALDDLEISYTSVSGSASNEVVDEDDTEDTEDTDIEDETETTTEAEKPTVSKDDTEDKADKDEEEGGLSTTMLIAIIAVVVVVIIIIIILIIALGGKKDKNQPQMSMPQQRPGSMPMTMPQGRPQMPSQPVPPAPRAPQMPQYSAPTAMSNEGAGETTVLNEGAGETTVLGAGAASAKTIVRMKNGDRIVVNRPEFMLGKERRRVDYCVADNNSVSRVHAKLVNRGGQLLLVDMNATNGTFVNGNRLSGGQEMPLNSGDKFKLADEEFQVQ